MLYHQNICTDHEYDENDVQSVFINVALTQARVGYKHIKDRARLMIKIESNFGATCTERCKKSTD